MPFNSPSNLQVYTELLTLCDQKKVFQLNVIFPDKYSSPHLSGVLFFKCLDFALKFIFKVSITLKKDKVQLTTQSPTSGSHSNPMELWARLCVKMRVVHLLAALKTNRATMIYQIICKLQITTWMQRIVINLG